MFSVITIIYISLLGLTHCALVPTFPGPNQVFMEGEPCKLSWNLDTENKWKSFSVDLMSGSYYNMTVVINVFKGQDGTRGASTYSWKCPPVTPNSAIYFYQFNQAGQSATWTTRFAIASRDGKLTPPAHPKQTNGQDIPWGFGKLRN